MRAKFLALAVAICGMSGAAQATAEYSAKFQVTEGQRSLRTGHAGLDGEGPHAGDWVGTGTRTASVNARELVSAAGAPAQYSDWRQAEGLHSRTGPLYTFGEVGAHLPAPAGITSGHAEIGWSDLRASISGNETTAEGRAEAVWTRGFTIDANTSFTFAGLAVFDVLGSATPFSLTNQFQVGPDQSFASLTLGDAAQRVRTTLSATLNGLGGLLPANIFSYAAGADGFMSLTITNSSSTALQGTLLAGTFVNVPAVLGDGISVAAPVPEPEALLLMLAGVGFVGAVARKRKATQAAATV